MAQTNLPHWQLESNFPSLESSEYEQAKHKLEEDLTQLETLPNEHNSGAREGLELSNELIDLFETLLKRFNTLANDNHDLYSYLTGFTSTDAINDAAQAEASLLKPLGSQFGTLQKRFTAWLGALDVQA